MDVLVRSAGQLPQITSVHVHFVDVETFSLAVRSRLRPTTPAPRKQYLLRIKRETEVEDDTVVTPKDFSRIAVRMAWIIDIDAPPGL